MRNVMRIYLRAVLRRRCAHRQSRRLRDLPRSAVIAMLVVMAACGANNVTNLQLRWLAANKSPEASQAVQAAFAATPFAFAVHDLRRDRTAVGLVEDDGYVVRTSDDVGAYVATHVSDYLERAGARVREAPLANVDLEVLELNVVEGGTFQAAVQLRVVVRRGEQDGWSQIYRGSSTRWGRTHNPENYNEALANAIEEATLRIIEDDGFGHALQAPPPGAAVGASDDQS
jgi:hypothetical protein